MKPTRNEVIYTVLTVAIIGTTLVSLNRYSDLLGNRSGQAMLATLVIAILILLALARLLLRGENTRSHKMKLSMIYHAIPVVAAAVGWLFAYVLSDNFQPIDLAWISVVGGGSLALHWLLTRNKAKGMSPKKTFL